MHQEPGFGPELSVSRRGTFPLYVCAGERIKLIGAIDGRFPDFGHHLEKEMGGLWLHPIKLLDGFWLRFKDCDAERVDVWTIADGFENRPQGNIFQYRGNLGRTPIHITRSQIAPETGSWEDNPGEGAGIIVDYSFFNSSREERRLEIEFLAKTDLRPVWFSEEQGIIDGEDQGEWLPEPGLFLAKDKDHPWYVAAGSLPEPEEVQTGAAAGTGPEQTAGRGTAVRFRYHLRVGGGERQKIRFILAGSSISRENCFWAYRNLSLDRDYWAEKGERYRNLLGKSRLLIDDVSFQTVYDWVKVNTDWLIMDAGVHGRGLGAGLPEYPWWFGCDNSYSLQGVLAMGDFRLCRDTLLLLLDYSEKVNGNGRVVHEVTTAGFCYNPGNTQEAAHFVSLVWRYYEWTGDRELLERAFPFLEQAVTWLRAQDIDGDGFPQGYGIIEIPGLNSKMLDTAVYTAQSYGSFARICALRGLSELAAEYEALEARSIEAINRVFWDEDAGLYCDTCTSVADVRARRDDILGRLYGSGAEEGRRVLEAALEKKAGYMDEKALSGWLLNEAWIINTPLETGIAPVDKARRALETLHGPRFTGPYGMYLSGLFRDQCMTISTGVMAVAQARYGYADRALELLKRMFSAFGMASPGSISEMLPDYGCFVQAWTIYAVMVPVVEYFFGLRPSASRNEVRLAPCMPHSWPRAELRRVAMLDGELDICYVRDGERETYRMIFSGSAPLCFELPPDSLGTAGDRTYSGGETVRAFGQLEIGIRKSL